MDRRGASLRDIVLDASFVGLVNLPDELPAAAAALLITKLDRRLLHVPSHWHLEVANMLVKAERGGRLDRGGRARVLRDVEAWPVIVDPRTHELAWPRILPLADEHGLTVYDAAYLELAQSKGAALASHDKQLLAAARRCAIDLITASE